MRNQTSGTRIVVTDDESHLKVDNGTIAITFSRRDGAWTRLTLDGVDMINHSRTPVVPADFKVNDTWMVDQHGCEFLGHRIAETPDSTVLTMNYGVGNLEQTAKVPLSYVKATPESGSHGATEQRFAFTLSCIFTVGTDDELRRTVRVVRNKERDPSGTHVVKFNAFLFRVPGAVVGPAETCIVDMPGAMRSKGDVIKPRTHYNEITGHYLHRRTSPDVDFGVVVLSNPAVGRYLACWLESTRTVFGCHLAGDGSTIDLLINEELPVYLHDGYHATSHEQTLRFGSGDQSAGLHAYGEYLTAAAPPMSNVPAWLDEAVIMEISPDYYGGFSGITERLQFLKETGFTTLYLMPLNKGGYWVADHYDIDEEKHGSIQELKEMVAQAHKLGMRVLMDLLVVMLTDESPLIAEHPEYFVRDEVGRILAHSEWEFPSTDYANEGFKQYIVDFATYWVREYGVDGFRVDAPGSKSPNWYPHSGHEPWETIMGAYDILGAVNRAIKAVNPEAILLDEMGGPICYEVCDLGHNHGSFYRIVNDADEENNIGFTIKDYKNLLSDVSELMPQGVNRVFYMRNHDTAWFYRFDGYTPRFHAYEAVHCLIKGIPLFFWGQKPSGGAPARVKDQGLWDGPDEAAFDSYRRLLAVRADNRALIDGECHYRGIDSQSDNVFSVVRTLGNQMIVALVNDAADPVTTNITVGSDLLSSYKGRVKLFDLFGSGSFEVEDLSNFGVELPAYGVAAYEVRQDVPA